MGDDISKKTVAILLVIAVLISVIGTWLVLTQEPDIRVENLQGDAKVHFEILPEDYPTGTPTGNAVVGFSVE